MTTEGRTPGQTPHRQPPGQRANRPPKGKAGGERGLNKKGLRGPNPTGGSSGSRSTAPAWLAEMGPLKGWAWSHGEDFPKEAPQTLGPPSHTRPCEVPGAGGDHKMPCKPPPRHRPTSPPHINPNSPQTTAPTRCQPPSLPPASHVPPAPQKTSPGTLESWNPAGIQQGGDGIPRRPPPGGTNPFWATPTPSRAPPGSAPAPRRVLPAARPPPQTPPALYVHIYDKPPKHEVYKI